MGLGIEDFEAPKQEEIDKVRSILSILGAGHPFRFKGIEHRLAPNINGGHSLLWKGQTNSEDRYFGSDIPLSTFIKMCNETPEEDIIIAKGSVVLTNYNKKQR